MCYERGKGGHYVKECQQMYVQIHQAVEAAMAGPPWKPKTIGRGKLDAGPKDESLLRCSL